MAQFAKLLIVTARAIASADPTAGCVASIVRRSCSCTTWLTIYWYKPSGCLATGGTSCPKISSIWLLICGEQLVCPMPGYSSKIPLCFGVQAARQHCLRSCEAWKTTTPVRDRHVIDHLVSDDQLSTSTMACMCPYVYETWQSSASIVIELTLAVRARVPMRQMPTLQGPHRRAVCRWSHVAA